MYRRTHAGGEGSRDLVLGFDARGRPRSACLVHGAGPSRGGAAVSIRTQLERAGFTDSALLARAAAGPPPSRPAWSPHLCFHRRQGSGLLVALSLALLGTPQPWLAVPCAGLGILAGVAFPTPSGLPGWLGGPWSPGARAPRSDLPRDEPAKPTSPSGRK